MKLALLLLLTCLALLMATEGARLTRFKGRDRGELRRKTNNNDYDADADANSDVNDDNDANGDDYNDGTRSRGALARSRTRTRDRNRDSLQQTDAAYNAVTFGIQLKANQSEPALRNTCFVLKLFDKLFAQTDVTVTQDEPVFEKKCSRLVSI